MTCHETLLHDAGNTQRKNGCQGCSYLGNQTENCGVPDIKSSHVGIRMENCCVPDIENTPTVNYCSHISPNGVNGDGARNVIVERFPVEFEGYTYQGWIAYSRECLQKPAPLVMVYPNYAGLKQFDIDMAAFIAQLGYVGVAVDLYPTTNYPMSDRNPPAGCSKQTVLDHFNGSFKSYNSRLRDPVRWRALQSLYLEQARAHTTVHPVYAGAIGYCFGGQCILEMVRNGDEVQGVVSFHGVLQSDPLVEPFDFSKGVNLVYTKLEESQKAPNRHNKDTKILILNGELDSLVTQREINLFESEMHDAGVKDWQFHTYSGTEHGFALPPGVFLNSFSRVADRRSTLAMIEFFKELWPEFPPRWVKMNAAGTNLEYHESKL
uniref:Dienelactone hydrolase domain-containing protein n=1 Tax=Mucochytrium quahogii TaxID=96639 RepID=A0A7S2WI70_9STRA|mmetsp:Transcript_3468/g.5010  ORF Transcript_3468/g.5010 Transcript_3468/m.5010 type:complete len:378 (-) Transcript_3468:82-1215(-)